MSLGETLLQMGGVIAQEDTSHLIKKPRKKKGVRKA